MNDKPQKMKVLTRLASLELRATQGLCSTNPHPTVTQPCHYFVYLQGSCFLHRLPGLHRLVTSLMTRGEASNLSDDERAQVGHLFFPGHEEGLESSSKFRREFILRRANHHASNGNTPVSVTRMYASQVEP